MQNTAAETKPSVQDRSTEFVPVAGGEETTSAEALLVAAYLLMWTILLGFVYLTWRKQRALGGQIDQLEARISKRRS